MYAYLDYILEDYIFQVIFIQGSCQVKSSEWMAKEHAVTALILWWITTELEYGGSALPHLYSISAIKWILDDNLRIV